MMQVNEFMKGLSLAELEYGKAIQRVIKPFKDELAKTKEKSDKNQSAYHSGILNSTVNKCWEGMLNGAEALSLSHIELAESLSTERKNLKGTAKDLEILYAEVRLY
jgi:hypothetical protein